MDRSRSKYVLLACALLVTALVAPVAAFPPRHLEAPGCQRVTTTGGTQLSAQVVAHAGTVASSTITGTIDAGCDVGVYVPAGVANVTVSGATITNYGVDGILVDGPGARANIVGNTITGGGPGVDPAQFGILVQNGAQAVITGNEVSDNFDAAGVGFSTGIYVINSAHVTISGNRLIDNQVGTGSLSVGGTVDDVTFSHNTIVGGNWGIAVETIGGSDTGNNLVNNDLSEVAVQAITVSTLASYYPPGGSIDGVRVVGNHLTDSAGSYTGDGIQIEGVNATNTLVSHNTLIESGAIDDTATGTNAVANTFS